MKKYKVFINGHTTYFANSEEEAIKNAEESLKVAHYSLNLDISGVKEEDNNAS